MRKIHKRRWPSLRKSCVRDWPRFQRNHKREATDFEFYVLWNAPWQADHPSGVVRERARRFANLVQS